jgi:hypothetical protein
MFNLKKSNSINTFKNILKHAKSEINRNVLSFDLLENIREQLNPDFISSACKANVNKGFYDDKVAPIKRGVIQITNKVGPKENTFERELDAEEVDELRENILRKMENVIGEIDKTPFDNIFGNSKEDFVLDVVDDLGESVEDLQEAIIEDNVCEDNVCEDCNNIKCTCEYDDKCPSCKCEDCCCGSNCCCDNDCSNEQHATSKIMPEKIVKFPTTIEGGGDWHRVKADVDIALRMSKNADNITKDHILTLIEPSKYENIDKHIQDELIDSYVDISIENNMNKISSRLEKTSYIMTGYPDTNSVQDRIRLEGPIPYNYQKWFKDCAESHDQAMSRLEEHKNKENELMKLRIKDGERANPIRKELSSIETRMQERKINNSEFSPLDNIETMLDNLEKKLLGRRDFIKDKSLELMLHEKQNVVNKTIEERLSDNKHMNDKGVEQIQSRIDEYLEDYDSIINEILKKDEAMSKVSGFGGGIKKNTNIKPTIEEKIIDNVNINDDSTVITGKTLSNMSIEEKLDPNNISCLKRELNKTPTSLMQEDNSTIAMASGPDMLLSHAAGAVWNDETQKAQSISDFERLQSNKIPWKKPNYLL